MAAHTEKKQAMTYVGELLSRAESYLQGIACSLLYGISQKNVYCRGQRAVTYHIGRKN